MMDKVRTQAGNEVDHPLSSPSRVGFVGAGNILKMHMQGLRRHSDRLTAAAVCDVDVDRLRDAAAVWSIPACYQQVEAMLENETLDACVVITPTHVRREVLLSIMGKGIPILCEKPLAETYAEAQALAAAARRNNVPVAVNQNFRRYFTFELARRQLAAGDLGRPLHLTQTVMNRRRDRGWRLERERYIMSVMSIHWFDGYRYLLGEEPRGVYCRTPSGTSGSGFGETAVSLLLDFPGGTVVNLNESFSSFAPFSRACLDCEQGSLIMDYEKLLMIDTEKKTVEIANPYDKPEATVSLLIDLCGAAEEGRPPTTDIADNLKSMRILEAAYKSMNEKRYVLLEEIQ
ncbi:MAG: Gfo/Idh/MocA family oxidoreductase [Candidatus Pacebacteria bacterium]|nr:Gfo/Idh/MocA family oxidoreductase [Candidatus Paceibacterota bacterium]